MASYIERAIEPTALEVAAQYPVVAILGPRQAGKTTLAKSSSRNIST